MLDNQLCEDLDSESKDLNYGMLKSYWSKDVNSNLLNKVLSS